MQDKLNIRLLLRLLLAIAVFGGCYAVVHAIQVNRHARDLLGQIRRCEEEGQPERAMRFLHLYLSMVPEDADARARFGMMMEKKDPSPQAKIKIIDAYQTVLFYDGSRNDIRRRLARLSLEVGDVDEAAQHLKTLLDDAPEDGELNYLLGVCRLVKLDYKKADELFRSAIQHEPSRLESYLELAHLLRHNLQKPDEADKVLDDMVAANQQTIRPLLARAAIRREQAVLQGTAPDKAKVLLQGAVQDVDEALKLKTSEPEALLLAAELAQLQERLEPARKYLGQGVHEHPTDARFWQAWATLEFKAGKPREAMKLLRQGLEQVPEAVEMLWSLGILLLQEGELKEALEVIERLRKTDLAPARLEYLTATLRLKEQRYFEARAAFESVRPQLANWPELTSQCDLYLGRCYEQTGAYDQQLIAYRRAYASDPLSLNARYGAAVALLRMGRRPDAQAEFQDLMRFPNPPAEGWPILARLMIVNNLAAHPRERKWEQVDQVLTKASQGNADNVEVQILRAEVLVAQGKLDDAQMLLQKTRDRHPKQVEVWVALSGLAARRGQPETALRVLAEAQQKLGDGVELRLARLRTLLSRSAADTLRLLAEVGAGLETFPEDARLAIMKELAEAYFALDQDSEAKSIWKQIAQLRPANLYVKLRLFDVALKSGDEDGMIAEVAEIGRQQGNRAGAYRYAEAQRLIWRARQGHMDGLEQARSLLDEVALVRPSWPAVPLSLAQICELEGKLDQALIHYQRALNAGDQQHSTIRRVVQLLIERGRSAEADEIINKLPEQPPISGELLWLVAESSLRAKNYVRALEMAKKAVAESKDYRDYIWLGELYGAAGEAAQAEAALRQALKMADQVPDTWVVLVQHLARLGQKEKAEELIAQARSKLPKDLLPITLAQCYEMLGRLKEAQNLYDEAREGHPGEASVLRSAASFYLRARQVKEAEPILRDIMALKDKSPTDADWARRTLGVVLALGNYQQVREALALLGILEGGEPAAPPGTVEDLHARAMALSALTGQRQRLQAIRLWEELDLRQPMTAKDRFLLAHLFELTGSWDKSRRQMLRLVEASGDDPGYLAWFVAGLLRHGELSEAARWLDKLQSLPNMAAAYEAVSLRARWYAAQNKAQEVSRVLSTYLGDRSATPSNKATRLHRVAELYEALAEAFPAEKSYARAAEEMYQNYVWAAKLPESTLDWAKFLGRRGHIKQALEVCERARRTCSAQAVAYATITVLREAPASKEQYQEVERWLEAALRENRQIVGLQFCLADLRDLEERYREAEELYRQVLAQDNNNYFALDNLAWLLAHEADRGAEALRLINHAIENQGPIPELVDTRAIAYLALGQPDLAIAELEDLVADPTMSPRLLSSLRFHLARAYHLAGRSKEAAEQLMKAKAAGLRSESLHSLERPIYRQLQSELETQ